MYEWIDDSAELQTWMAPRTAHATLSLDTEFMRTNTFVPKLALIQLNIDGAIAVLDSPKLGAHEALAVRLRDPLSTCVMHSASEDLEALASIVPDGPAVLFDTQIAAALCGLGFGLSYQRIVALLLGIELPKSETRSDWLQRPLSAAQLDYAAQDVEHLPEIHAQLAAKLAERGRTQWLAEDCRRMIDRIRHTAPDLQPQRGYRAAADWPPINQAILRRLLLWREAAARQYDKPRSWLLDDAHALNLAERPPLTANELFERTKGLRALRSPQRAELFALLNEPPSAADLAIAPIPSPLTSTEKRAVAAMKDSVIAVAQELDIPEGLLCPRRHLETLVTDRAWPTALEGWREPLLHERLMGLLPDLGARG